MDSTKIRNEEFLDILFAGRNKEYGAYELRSRYNARVRNAVMGTASIVLVMVGGYIWNNADANHTERIHKPLIPVTIMPTPIDPITEKPPVLPPPPATQATPPPLATMNKYVAPVVTSENVEEEVPTHDELRDHAIGYKNEVGVEGGADNVADLLKGNGGDGVVKPPVAEAREEIVSFVEIMPEFPGGEKALMKYLNNNVHYPRVAEENGIEGTVYIQFVVWKDGSISEVKLTGAHKGGGLEEEAARVVRSMPKWKPGRQNGQYVAVYYTLPISFRLTNN
ncbi:energy transducer TonB [Chitinophaga sp. Cy-1792]|uniref:energy transducer TonB n=1 Tax=Chitinophaga sp. Cy-1792 TaxID=2608339 RepID=UPI001423EFC1|nr:energy transducer TonB [Chitinophaga sp. Cy-1792]NIG56863.1 energy transducer TonB [Chitinophaga sp. Cy-1792]